MNTNKRSQYEDDPEAHLEKVSDRYIFDGSSGLYKPKGGDHSENASTDTTGHYKRFPFWVNVRRDWLAVILSAISLILFAVTVHYARKQWYALNDTLGEVKKQTGSVSASAGAAQSAAATASNSLDWTKSQFRQDQRPYLLKGITGSMAQFQLIQSGPHAGGMSFSVPVQNYGKSPADVYALYSRIATNRSEMSGFPAPSDRLEREIIPPGDNPKITAYSRRLTPTEMDAFQKGNAEEVILLYMEYTDIFGAPSPTYSLSYCTSFLAAPNGGDVDHICDGRNKMK